MTAHSSSSLWQRPSTRLGWWAVGMVLAFVAMFVINVTVIVPASENAPNAWWRQTWLPFFWIFMLLCGIAAGVVGLIAVIRKNERSWLVWLTILLGAFALLVTLIELLVPH
jgi:hypothetical protein